MRRPVLYSLAVAALTAALANPAVVHNSRPHAGDPLASFPQPSSTPPRRPHGSRAVPSDVFFAPYRLSNMEPPDLERPSPKMLWIAKEIEHLDLMRDRDVDSPHHDKNDFADYGHAPLEIMYDYRTKEYPKKQDDPNPDFRLTIITSRDQGQKNFALTPIDEGFYAAEPPPTANIGESDHSVNRRRDEPTDPGFEDLRSVRQNPNKVKNLVADHEDRKPMQIDRSQIPVSLIPTSLQKLRLLQRTHAEARARNTPPGEVRQVQVVAEDVDSPASLYAVAVFTAMGAALSIAVVAIGVGYYRWSKKMKAAEDVDYPAYGVTGPSGDNSGDKKLAQSAHMYHYQHQKQQIIAMERGDAEGGNGSISDVDSEEENEEGDYTVYECPGFATTGDMEVKNPLFSDEPTPATPAAIPAPSPSIVVDDNDE